jgi:hypothetical protein
MPREACLVRDAACGMPPNVMQPTTYAREFGAISLDVEYDELEARQTAPPVQVSRRRN